MFAVIKTGGKQYKVTPGDVLMVEKLSAKAGDKIAFDEVLMVSTGSDIVTGQPLVANAKVEAQVLEPIRGEKVIIFKKRRRHTYRRKRGHRQDLLVVRILGIHHGGSELKAAKPAKAKAAPKAPESAPKAEKAAAPKKASPKQPKADA
jgi:large subunit ribosomal protein L21